MLRRPGGSPSDGGRRARQHLRHAVEDQAVRSTEDEQVAALQRTSVNGPVRRVDPRHPEDAGVAQADRDDRFVHGLIPVLVQAEAGVWRVQVDDRRVGREVGAPCRRSGAVGVVDGPPGQRSTRWSGIGLTGAPSVSSAVRE